MNDKIHTPKLHLSLPLGLILALVAVSVALAAGIDDTNKWARGTNIGWINFKPTNGDVTAYSDHLEGYVWGENIGWLRLGTHTGGGAHIYANDAADTYGVNNDSAGNLSGYAWGTNVGWINFNPANGGVTITPATGEFDGYAWGENVGWIHFQNTDPAYMVKTNHPLAVNLASFTVTQAGDHNALAWETVSELRNLGFNVWRGASASAPEVKLNDLLIPSQAPGGTDGFAYNYNDFDIASGANYYYWLEDVDLNGTVTRHGPVLAAVNGPTTVTLRDLTATADASPGIISAVAAALVALGAALIGGRRLKVR